MSAVLAEPEKINFDEFLVRHDGYSAEWVGAEASSRNLQGLA
ncbi:MAG TPA: hypothetical protein VFJ16_06150 [Longimicrobium sp.]|nr:hypothetical protein [Longimicrobium sp.]